MPLVSVLGCGTWFFLIEEQLYWQCRGLLRCHVTLPGALATTMEHWDAAAQHFEDALAMNTRMDAWTLAGAYPVCLRHHATGP